MGTKTQNTSFSEHDVLHQLKHYLPAQAPLKDFIHHNTLHAFQNLKFFEALRRASEIFGYKVSLSLNDYRALYNSGLINEAMLDHLLAQSQGNEAGVWKFNLLSKVYENGALPRIGGLRSNWKRHYKMDIDSIVHPILFRIVCSYLDQGISIWNFPVKEKTFLSAIRDMERESFASFFKGVRAKKLLLESECHIGDLLKILVGDESLYERYLFDQQFAHQGWSGIVSTIEDQPNSLLDQRQLSIHDLIVFELLLEIDALDFHFSKWLPIAEKIKNRPSDLFAPVVETEFHHVMRLWQEAFEWTYYDQVLAGMTLRVAPRKIERRSFQVMFCIDDRETSLRRYLEGYDENCETFGTPGFFGAEFYYQPEDGKFFTKVCPAPVTPKYLIKEVGSKEKHKVDFHFSKHAHSFYSGWLISQTLGFWSAAKLFFNIFRPTMSPATASSFKHMDKFSRLTIENKNKEDRESDLQVGFAIDEMAQRAEGLLRSIGLVKDFAPLVYVVGHGSSSANNPHYAAYDCGACSGRAGSVNARAISYMANHPKVRAILAERGIVIPEETQFVGGLHDTTRDEISFFDEALLTPRNLERHQKNELVFDKALDQNAKERSRRFESINTRKKPQEIHKEVRIRSVSIFEPRPELNHATNALCIVGRRSLTKDLFLDRRAFLNSYDYSIDLEGNLLLGIMRPLGPVCGGINLEYFFSRVDNQKLGAGTKLPHNVMGLFGVANGIDGDLRPGLPSQMIEVHDPIRLLIIVEHFPDVVLKTIQKQSEVYEWFINEWVHLVAVDPETQRLYYFKDGAFADYCPLKKDLPVASDINSLVESSQDNIPVHVLAQIIL